MDPHTIKKTHACLVGALAAVSIGCYNLSTNDWDDHHDVLLLLKSRRGIELNGGQAFALSSARVLMESTFNAYASLGFDLIPESEIENTIQYLEEAFPEIIILGNY